MWNMKLNCPTSLWDKFWNPIEAKGESSLSCCYKAYDTRYHRETSPSPIIPLPHATHTHTHTHTHTSACNTNKRSTHSGRFLAHLSTLSILEAMHAHQPLFAKTQKLSMLLTLHDNHHYKNEENNKYAHTCIAFGEDQVRAMWWPCRIATGRKEALFSDPKSLLHPTISHP
jgi:hypothetical protein